MAKKKSDDTVTNALALQNGLADAIGLGSNFPQGYGIPGTEPVANVNTMFKNLRWYLVSNFRQVLSELYVEIGLVQTIVDVPVDDGLRHGVTIKSKQLDEAQIEELQIALERDDDIVNVGQAAKWNRLFGGAGILILTDQDPETPLDMDAINEETPLEFRPIDMWELYWTQQNTQSYDSTIQTEDFEFYNYYGERVHKSRVLRMKGMTAPSFIRPRLRGWGFSVVEVLIRSINQYLKATDLGFEVLDEFKVDVFKMKNLVNTLLSPGGQDKIRKRVELANLQKNFQSALVMDSEDDWDHKQLSFSGLGETMQGIRIQVASDLRMPMTKLFGISAAGFNSGEDDIEVYNAMVESQVRAKIKKPILTVIELKCKQLFGMIPDDLSITFPPLRVLSAEQEETVKTQKFTRLIQARTSGEITSIEFRDAANRGTLFDISLDTEQDMLNPDDPEVAEIVQKDADPDADKEREDIEAESDAKDKEADEAGKDDKTENAIKPYTREQRIDRVLKNSAEFDRASYEADGGDNWVDSRRAPLFENPGNVDEALWEKAKDASVKAFGKVKWQFVAWWYKKQGGKFIKGDR